MAEARRRGIKVPDLAPPRWALQVVSWFNELNRRRGGSYGPDPITHQDVLAWCMLTNRTLVQEELDLIFLLDDTYRITWVQVKGKKKRGKEDSE